MKISLDFAWLIDFLNSNLFLAASIVFTGLYIVDYYKKQKIRARAEAASVVLGEIYQAERSIEEIAHRLTYYIYGEYPSVLPTNSWAKYKNLFVSELDRDEREIVDEFYQNSALIEEFVRRERDIFWRNAESRSHVVQEKLGEAVMRSYHRGVVDRRILSDYKKLVLDEIANDEYTYYPKYAVSVLDNYVVRARRITDTSVWTKLKLVAKK